MYSNNRAVKINNNPVHSVITGTDHCQWCLEEISVSALKISHGIRQKRMYNYSIYSDYSHTTIKVYIKL